MPTGSHDTRSRCPESPASGLVRNCPHRTPMGLVRRWIQGAIPDLDLLARKARPYSTTRRLYDHHRARPRTPRALDTRCEHVREFSAAGWTSWAGYDRLACPTRPSKRRKWLSDEDISRCGATLAYCRPSGPTRPEYSGVASSANAGTHPHPCTPEPSNSKPTGCAYETYRRHKREFGACRRYAGAGGGYAGAADRPIGPVCGGTAGASRRGTCHSRVAVGRDIPSITLPATAEREPRAGRPRRLPPSTFRLLEMGKATSTADMLSTKRPAATRRKLKRRNAPAKESSGQVLPGPPIYREMTELVTPTPELASTASRHTRPYLIRG